MVLIGGGHSAASGTHPFAGTPLEPTNINASTSIHTLTLFDVYLWPIGVLTLLNYLKPLQSDTMSDSDGQELVTKPFKFVTGKMK